MMAEVIRANISRPYLLRLCLVSFFSLGLAFWCVYDGLVTYPDQRKRGEAYKSSLDDTLMDFKAEAENASRSMAVSLPPANWPPSRWNEEIESVLLAQRNATTAEQKTYFLQLAWLYLNVPPKATEKISEGDLSRFRSTLRKALVKFLNNPDEYSSTSEDPIDRAAKTLNAAWSQLCDQNDWSTEYPGEPKNIYAIDQQFYMAAGIIPFSLFFLFTLLRQRNAWIEADENGLRNSRNASLRFEEIDKFDKKRWDKKGIAWIHYTSETGKKKFLLDDCNFDYKPIRAIVRLVESHINSEMIVGGKPEPPEKSASAEQALINERQG